MKIKSEKKGIKTTKMFCAKICFYFIIFSFLLLHSGCKVQVHYPSEFPSKTVIKNEETFWFWGLIGEKNYEIYDICPQGRVYEFRIYSTIAQSTFTILSLGIYSPRTVTIVCSIRGE